MQKVKGKVVCGETKMAIHHQRSGVQDPPPAPLCFEEQHGFVMFLTINFLSQSNQ
jgi:hypothetical protein